MQKFIEVTGRTDEEALARGLEQLGLDRDDVSLEILERGKTGFLGIGSVPARVRLTYEAPDEPEPAPTPAAPVEQKAPAGEKPAAQKAPAEKAPRAESRPQKPRADKPRQEKKPAPAPETKPQAPAAPVSSEDETAAAIVAFQTGLFARMGVEAVPAVTRTDEAYLVTIEGEDLAPLIGRRGETLDAIQQLTGYAVNRDRSHRVRVRVDAEGYRARREDALTRLARKTAGKAVKYRRSVTLEPMNAYERHVIHTALQDYDGVSTHSTGVEPNRRVVVTYEP